MSNPHPQNLSMLEKRRIDAALLEHVYETLKASAGEDVARRTVAEAVRRSSVEQAARFAASVDGNTNLRIFIDLQPLWTCGARTKSAKRAWRAPKKPYRMRKATRLISCCGSLSEN